jgi:hypothetical protein
MHVGGGVVVEVGLKAKVGLNDFKNENTTYTRESWSRGCTWICNVSWSGCWVGVVEKVLAEDD